MSTPSNGGVTPPKMSPEVQKAWELITDYQMAAECPEESEFSESDFDLDELAQAFDVARAWVHGRAA